VSELVTENLATLQFIG